MLREIVARWRARRLEKIADEYGYMGEDDRAALQQGRDAIHHMTTPTKPQDRIGPDWRGSR